MACRFTYNGKTYDQDGLAKALRDMPPSEAHKYIPDIKNIPDAPFVGDTNAWASLALKRMIRKASDEGYQRISWDTGATNADRYDLSKQVDSIWATKNPTGTFNLEFIKDRGHGLEVLHERIGPHVRDVHPDKLSDLVGKELAEKVSKQQKSEQQYTGVDLKVGGEGMKGFYDRLLPNVANKLVKKYGAKVEESGVSTGPIAYAIEPSGSQFIVKGGDSGNYGIFKTKAQAQQKIDELKSIDQKYAKPVHSIKITPELRKAAMTQGFPLFATGGSVPTDTGPETAKQRIEGEFKDLYRQQRNNPSLTYPYFEPSEPGMPIKSDEISEPPWGSGGLRTERQEGGPAIPENQSIETWRPSTNIEDARNETALDKLSNNFMLNVTGAKDNWISDISNRLQGKPTVSEQIKQEAQRPQFANGGSATTDYDYDAANAAGVKPDARGHLPDTYKLPNHITFSDESIYHGKDGNEGGHWSPISGSDNDPENQRWLFTPGKTNLENHTPQELQDYFQTYEPNSVVNIPQGFPGFAHGGRVEPRNIDHHPSEAQKHANNYAHDKIHVLGMKISIENARGSYRRGVGKDGKEWKVKMPHHYGYLLGTEARDLDHVDCYVGPHIKSPHIFVIDQVDHETGKYDEAKCLIGFGTERQAIDAYKRGFSDGKGEQRIGKITGMNVRQFRDWLEHGETHKPFAHVADRKERVKEILKRAGV